jgi:shikimate kinase
VSADPRARALPARISLIGFMGAGKSTVARILARQLDYDLVDLDGLIETRARRSIPRIFTEQGEGAFRDMEARALEGLAARERLVIAAGGGAPLQERNRPFFARMSATFHLAVSLEVALDRTRRGAERPLLARGAEEVRLLYERRLPVYRSLGTQVDTDTRTPEDVAREILRLLEGPTATEHPVECG